MHTMVTIPDAGHYRHQPVPALNDHSPQAIPELAATPHHPTRHSAPSARRPRRGSSHPDAWQTGAPPARKIGPGGVGDSARSVIF